MGGYNRRSQNALVILGGARLRENKGRLKKEEHAAEGHAGGVREEVRGRLALIEKRLPWTRVLIEAGRRFAGDEMVLHAANFAFSAFLSIFPLILIVASVFGYIFKYNPDVMQTVINDINKALPQLGVVVNTAANSLIEWRGLAAIIGVIGLLLSTNRIVFSVRKGFGRIWEIPKPKFFKKYVMGILGSLFMVLLGIAVFLASYVSSQAISWISKKLGPAAGIIFLILGILVTVATYCLILAILYWIVPQNKSRLKAIAWGALLAGSLIEVSTYVINIYLNRISKLQAVFGSLGVVVGLLLWLYFAGLMLFFGAEVVKVLHNPN